MAAILEQLEINSTFFAQILIFTVLYFILKFSYFKPFMALFEKRHKETVSNRERAEKLLEQVLEKQKEYEALISEGRLQAQREADEIIASAKKEEANLIAHARDEMKKITIQAQEAMAQQKAQLKAELTGEVDTLAQSIADKLLSRKA